MTLKFYIIGSNEPRPSTRKTIFVDGTPSDSPNAKFREGIDIELSHWFPNNTPMKYKADTSTEICMNFVSTQPTDDWDLVINNHLDVDGILSVFTIVHSDFALKNRKVIVKTAEIGDFWQYGKKDAQVLFQGLTLHFNKLEKNNTDIREIYAKSFEKVKSLINEDHSNDQKIKEPLSALKKSIDKIKFGTIKRNVFHERFVHYHISKSLSKIDLQATLNVPEFNAPLSNKTILLPQARNNFDKEKVQLVSVETDDGYYYDLWYPGYSWAETPDSWRAPGFKNESLNSYYYGFDPLNKAVVKLEEQEKNNGKWIIADKVSFNSSIEGRGFPVVVSFMIGKDPAPSSLSPDEVSSLFASAFENL